MKHAHKQFDHIQDPSGNIPEDEPVFLLRAQDDIAWKILEEYVRLRRQTHFKPDAEMDEMSKEIMAHADKMREWPEKKIADMPELSSALPVEDESLPAGQLGGEDNKGSRQAAKPAKSTEKTKK